MLFSVPNYLQNEELFLICNNNQLTSIKLELFLSIIMSESYVDMLFNKYQFTCLYLRTRLHINQVDT